MSPIKPSRLWLGALLLAAALAPAAVTSQAAADPAKADTVHSSKSCFYSREISGFRAVDDDTVDLTVGVNDVYRVTTLGVCSDLSWAEGIGVKTRAGGDFICDSMDIDLIVPRTGGRAEGGPDRCPVASLRKLTPEEAKAPNKPKSK